MSNMFAIAVSVTSLLSCAACLIVAITKPRAERNGLLRLSEILFIVTLVAALAARL